MQIAQITTKTGATIRFHEQNGERSVTCDKRPDSQTAIVMWLAGGELALTIKALEAGA